MAARELSGPEVVVTTMPLTGRIWFEASFKRTQRLLGGEWSLGPLGSQRRRGRAGWAVDEEVLD